MEREVFTLSTHDGAEISVARYARGTRSSALIICPGFLQSKETLTFQRLSSALSSEYDVICLDFRGHGHSSGLYTFSAREPIDLEVVFAWAKRQYPKISLLGFSMGAAISLIAASHHPETLQSVIAVSAPTAFDEIRINWRTAPESMKTGMQGFEKGMGCRPGNLFLKKESPIERIPLISPTPVLLIHGTLDLTIPHTHSERLYAAAKEPKRLSIIQGGGHAEALFRNHPEEFLPLVRSWLVSTLTV